MGDKPRPFHSLIRSFVSEGDRYATAAKNVRLVAKDSVSVSPSAYAFMILLVRLSVSVSQWAYAARKGSFVIREM